VIVEWVWVIIVAQLLVSLYLAWELKKLSDELEMMKVIVGGILMGIDQQE
jgi:hypothetical protein